MLKFLQTLALDIPYTLSVIFVGTFLPVMLKRRPCGLQTVQTVQTVQIVQIVQIVQTECYFFNLYLNFLVKF